MYGVEKKPSQNNSIKPTLRDNRDGDLNNDISHTLGSRNEYDDNQYKTIGANNGPKKMRKKSTSNRSKSEYFWTTHHYNSYPYLILPF